MLAVSLAALLPVRIAVQQRLLHKSANLWVSKQPQATQNGAEGRAWLYLSAIGRGEGLVVYKKTLKQQVGKAKKVEAPAERSSQPQPAVRLFCTCLLVAAGPVTAAS